MPIFISNYYSMKKIYLCLVAALFSASTLFAQNYEPKETPYVDGEMLLQLRAGYSIEQVINEFPQEAKMHSIALLSKHMRFWHIGFDHTIISNAQVLHKLMGMPSINLAQNNHYIEERATVPNDVNFGSQWHHKNTGASGGTVDADIDSDEAGTLLKVALPVVAIPSLLLWLNRAVLIIITLIYFLISGEIMAKYQAIV